VLDAAGYGMLAPVLPEIGERTGTGPAVAGALVACFALGQLVGYPFAAALAARRGSSFVLGISLVLLLVGDAGFVAGDGLAAWFPSRGAQGLGAAGLWIGVTFAILEHWPDSAYPRLTGVLAAYAVGSIFGPALGAVEGIRAPFLLHALMTAVAFLPLLALRGPHARARFGTDRSVLRSRQFAVAAAGIVLISLAIGTIDGPLPLHLASELEQAEIAGLYVVVAILVAFGSAAAGRMSPAAALWAGALLIPPGIGVVGATGSVPPWALGLIVAGAGFGLGEAGALGFLLSTVERERIVTAWVIYSQLWAIGYLVGPAVAGLVAEWWGFGVLGAVPLAGSLLVAWTLRGGGAQPAANSAA
jgi:DHA1 family multidrug resistance protein-like MFS transporter